MREGVQPIGGPRLHKHTTPGLAHRQHPRRCFDPEDGSLDCVCGLTHALREAADAAAEQFMDDDDDPFPFIDLEGNEVP